jgi:A-macroglobulin TED domain/Alpha-2-macroglobulin family/Carboxypeptidase regulatory-like domain/MG2 domain/A-macroglobulin receptor binding domain/Alpha-2-macroglobulin bait region domain
MRPGLRRPALRCLLSFALVLIVFTVACSFGRVHAQPTEAAYANGRLAVTIPYSAASKGSGKLVAELLDPEDHVLGRSEASVNVTRGDVSWQQVITPDQPVSLEDIVWHRLHYRFDYNDASLAPIEGIESISDVLRRPAVHIIGQTQYLSGSQASVRVIVSDAQHTDIPESGAVAIELLQPGGNSHPLFSGPLNRRGTLEAQFRFPAGLTGNFQIRYVADTPIGSAEFTQAVKLQDKAFILLTTEKPIYQPGQTIHIRALSLDRADSRAEAGRKLTFEIEDSRGNKVFKKATETDNFGIASAEFSLADEVNLGTYHLRALMGDPAAPANTSEVALDVERYVLPKFKVAVEFTPTNGKPRLDYRPGDRVTGTVRANYFFGKPVDRAAITVKASSADVAVFDVASASGKTDAEGVYKFDLKLPSYFAGRPLSQGAARALVEAKVTDSADHAETRGEPITISESSMLLTAVPEGGSLVPNIENQVYLLASYPDGTPATAALTVAVSGARDQQVTTDSSGVAVIRLNPGSGMDSLHIEADDHHGNRATATAPLETRAGDDQILLRASRAVLKAGDRLQLTVLSTRAHGTAYVDIVRNGQTILTRDLDLDRGHADLNLTVTPEMAGTLDIDAYLFGRNAQPVADHRLVFVYPADELKIETTTDAVLYKPGSDARIRFHVTNASGQGVSAALGLQIVDEAVFALAEKKPGFAKVFFYLEQEAMKPRYEIHSLTMSDVIEPAAADNEGQQDLAARALFSATEMTNPAKLDTSFAADIPRTKFAEYMQRYRVALVNKVRAHAVEIDREIEAHRPGDVFDSLTMRDASGTPLRLEPTGRYGGDLRYYVVRSAGPDRKFNTADDFTFFHLEGGAGIGGISGTIADASGAGVPKAEVTATNTDTGVRTSTVARNGGHYTIQPLQAGPYNIEVVARGFERLLQENITVDNDSMLGLPLRLTVGSTTQTVTVTDAPAMLDTTNATLGGTIENEMYSNLPLSMNGGPRAATAFQYLMPGVQATGAAAANGNSGIYGGTGATNLNENYLEGMPVLKVAAGRGAGMAVKKVSADAAPHVRSYFPEALYINPEIITDGKGNATISIPVADSITTWRMAMLASTQSGALGSGTSSLKVFQDFFVDLDLPVTLTQGDRVSIPVAAYNYSGKPVTVTLQPDPDAWYTLEGDLAQKSVSVESGGVGGTQFTIGANRIGKFKLTLTAQMNGAGKVRRDIVVREIEVIPNGREQDLVFNGNLQNSVEHDLHFPASAIPESTNILVRLYPGPLSQVIEGMDSLLRMPGGCFEQTSSSTYPNVLALGYMKRTNKLTPEVHAKAEGYIANGYQRLLTFEVPGGGFSWFGQAPANKILTAYGLMEFNDMSKVADVDPRLIERTSAWLARQQQADGSWRPDTGFINEGATNRYNTNVLRITAYIAWSLANIGYQGPAVDRARHYIESQSGTQRDTYTLAIIANFAADYARDSDFTRQSMQALLDARTDKGDQTSWTAEETGVYSTGGSAAIETTGLATQALLKWGQASETVRKALNFISSQKRASGDWGTTQATIVALRALLLASERGTADVRGNLQVILNGKPVESLTLTPENNDLLHQFVFKGIDAQQSNSVQLKFEGTGGLGYQIVGRTFTPWEAHPVSEPLSIDVTYDRTKLAQDDIATAKVIVRNNLSKTANMIMVDLGIPPGFDLLGEDLQSLQEKAAGNQNGSQNGSLQKFSLTATQAILYFNALSPRQTVTFTYRLRAKYPIHAHTFQSRVYEYYDPDVTATAAPVQLDVAKH